MAGMDVQAFLTGFFETTAENIKKRKEKAEDEIDYFKRNRDAYIEAAEQRKQLRDNAGILVTRLKNYGVTDEMIAAAAAEGPTGLTDLSRTLSTAVNKQGLKFVQDNLGMYVDATIDKTAFGENLDINTILDQAYGIGSYQAGDYKPTKEYGFFDKLFGKNAMDEAYAELDQEPLYDGMSLYDLRQYSQGKAYKDVGGDSYITYKSPLVFSPDDVSGEVIELNRIKNTVESNEDYIQAEADVKQARKDIEKYDAFKDSDDPANKALYDNAVKALELAQNRKSDLLSQFLDPYLEGRIGTYTGDTYMMRMGTSIDSLFGVPGYSEKFSLTDEPLTAATEEQAISAAVSDASKSLPKPEPKEPVYSDNPVIAKLQKGIADPAIDFIVTNEGLQLVYNGKDGSKTYSVEQTKAFFEKNKASFGDLSYASVYKALDEEGIGQHGLSWWEKGFTLGANEKGVPDITVEEETPREEITRQNAKDLSWWEKGFTVGANEPVVSEPTEEDKPATMDITEGPVVEDMTRENAPADIKADYKEWLEDNDVEDSPEAFKQFIEEELPIVEG